MIPSSQTSVLFEWDFLSKNFLFFLVGPQLYVLVYRLVSNKLGIWIQLSLSNLKFTVCPRKSRISLFLIMTKIDLYSVLTSFCYMCVHLKYIHTYQCIRKYIYIILFGYRPFQLPLSNSRSSIWETRIFQIKTELR